jgi:2-desacetyl-2-hydroxyethyl bacteriochlorophyllide A dehydrogenase
MRKANPKDFSSTNTKNTLFYGGGFAEYCKVHKTQILKLDDDFDLNKAPIIEPLAVAIHIARNIPSTFKSKVAIVGSGTIAYLLARYLNFINTIHHITIIVKHSPIKKLLRGNSEIIDYDNTLDLKEQFYYSIDCAGTQQSFDSAYMLIKKGGTLITSSLYNTSVILNMSDVMFSEKTIKGAFLYSNKDFEDAKSLIETNLFSCSEVISKSYFIKDINEAFLQALYNKDEYMKIVVSNQFNN